MQENLVNALRTRRPQIRSRWEDLLRIERASTPLANPDTLVHMLDWTINEIFHALGDLPARRRHAHRAALPDYRHECPCGRNPLLVYFAGGEQTMREALILAQAETPALDPFERDAAMEELNSVLQHIARREIEAFCGVCQHRHPHDQHATAVGLCGATTTEAHRENAAHRV